MCDFCENIIQKQGRNFELYEVAIVYDTEDKEYIIADESGEYLGIDYCPLCGRKLSEETEKPSTGEILATLKEKLTEDEYLKLKESAEMFFDGINGLWEVLRKGIENGLFDEEPLPFSCDECEEDRIDELEKRISHLEDYLAEEKERKIKELKAEQALLMSEAAHCRFISNLVRPLKP